MLAWYDRVARDLPWRRTRDPYAIWVSEIMLQQTQVSTVLRYYEPFLARFPTVHALAAAPLGEVFAAWAGLGYYARARKLKAAAEQVVERHGGAVPDDAMALAALPGVGRYTAGAIRSIAFDRGDPIVDGNVARVLARLFGVDLEDGPRRQALLWEIAAALVPPGGQGLAGRFNQGLMELGALVCTRTRPGCLTCPWQAACVARREGRAEELPRPQKRARVKELTCVALLCRHEGRLLLGRRHPEGLLGGLWELPLADLAPGKRPEDAAAEARRLLPKATGLQPGRRRARALVLVEHVFTHRRRQVVVVELEARAPAAAGSAGLAAPPAGSPYVELRWVRPDELAELPLSSAARSTLAACGALSFSGPRL